MAKQAELAVSPREVTGKATKQLRRAGIIPANVFGHGEESQALQVEIHAFNELRRNRQAAGVIALKIEGAAKVQTVLVRHIKRDPIHDKILHIDFLRVNMRDRLTVKVPLHFEGTAPGVKLEGGVLLHQVESLDVECAAGDIVEVIEVDISTLEHIDDAIHAKDVKLPAHYTLITDPEETVVKVTHPRIVKDEETTGETTAEASTPKAAESPEA